MGSEVEEYCQVSTTVSKREKNKETKQCKAISPDPKSLHPQFNFTLCKPALMARMVPTAPTRRVPGRAMVHTLSSAWWRHCFCLTWCSESFQSCTVWSALPTVLDGVLLSSVTSGTISKQFSYSNKTSLKEKHTRETHFKEYHKIQKDA